MEVKEALSKDLSLDVDDGDDSETSDDVFDKCTALNCLINWSLIFQVPVLTRPYRIGKKTPGRVRPIIVSRHSVTT